MICYEIKKVAAYARVSSGKDAMMHSLSAQISYYSKFIQDNSNWQYVVRVYADEARTGTDEIDEKPWYVMVDKVVVRKEENIEFQFRNSN